MDELPAAAGGLDHERHVERAIELAREAADRGDEPYGSLLVDAESGSVVMEERNAVLTANDLRRHPELTLAERAAREYTPSERALLVMYTSTEPCPMCAGGIGIAGLGAVVHSVSAESNAAIYGSEEFLPSAEVYERLGADTVSAGPVLPDAGAAVHEEFRE